MDQKKETAGATPTINFETFPKEKAERLAVETLKAVKAFLAQPGGREFLDQQMLKRKRGD